jgi:hypothetical protein
MKRIASLALVGLFFLAMGSFTSVSGEEVMMGVDVSITQNFFGRTTINFIPETPGRDGDGFVVYNDSSNPVQMYFIPEGESLTLEKGKKYRLCYARVYQTNRGWVLGDTFYMPCINPDGIAGAIVGDIFSYPVYSVLVPMNVISDFEKGGYLLTGFYMVPPFMGIKDAVRVVYDPFVRCGKQPISETYDSDNMFGRIFQIPADGCYVSATFSSLIYDGERTIVSSSKTVQ